MAKQKALVRLVAKKDGTVKTAGWRAVDAVPVGLPFNVQGIMVSGMEPERPFLEEKLRGRDFDAYSVGKGSFPSEGGCARRVYSQWGYLEDCMLCHISGSRL